jgi:hypothetical protein
MNCILDKWNGKHFVCSRKGCNSRSSNPTAIIMPCKGLPKQTKVAVELPLIHKQVITYSLAYMRHAANGFAERSAADVDRIFTTCCAKCSYYITDKGKCGHSKCGCNVSASVGVRNKIVWESEHCPLVPPLW